MNAEDGLPESRGFVIGDNAVVINNYYPSMTRAVVTRIRPDDRSAASGFVGRAGEVEALSDASAAPLTLITGLGGVGKTALARQAAARAVREGRFPGGAFFVDMHGYSAARNRVSADHVFAPFLRAAGLDRAEIAATVDEQAAQYHRFLAEQAGPVLLVLDNVGRPGQITDLLPPGTAHRVLVTSRHTLAELPGVRVLELGALSTAEATNLVDQALKQRNPADQRVPEQAADAAELAALCGRLPLALQAVAFVLADFPERPIAQLVHRLATPERRLRELSYGEDLAVERAFDLSWQHLVDRHEPAAQLLRLLALQPGNDFSSYGAAALAGLPPDEVPALLDELRRAHLLQPAGADRYQFHDLMRLYAHQRCTAEVPEPDRNAAVDRMIAHYGGTLEDADEFLHGTPSRNDSFASRDEALDWCEAEFANLVALASLAHDTGRDREAFAFAFELRFYLDLTRRFGDLLQISERALDSAGRLDDPRAPAYLLNSIGVALRELGEVDAAIKAHELSLKIFRANHDEDGEGVALDNLGLAYGAADRGEDAMRSHLRSLELVGPGNHASRAVALMNTGSSELAAGRTDRAMDYFDRARQAAREAGDEDTAVSALIKLGSALTSLERFAEAEPMLRQAIDDARRLRHRHRLADALGGLGILFEEQGRYAEAAEQYVQEVPLRRELGDTAREGSALSAVAAARQAQGRLSEAIQLFQEAIELLAAAGDRRTEGYTRASLGFAHDENGDRPAAVAAWRAAIPVLESAGEHESARNLRKLLGDQE